MPDEVSTLIISMMHMRRMRFTKGKLLARGHTVNKGRARTLLLCYFVASYKNNSNLATKPKINGQMHVNKRNNFIVLCICLLIDK